MQISDIIREISDATGFKQVKLAQKLHVSQGTISKWLADKQTPNYTQWEEIQTLIRRDPRLEHLRFRAETGSVAVMGRIGAGAVIDPEIEQIPPEGLYSLSLPFAIPADMLGFAVEGDSMYPKYEEGDVVIVYKDQRHATPGYIGQLVALRTEDGRRFLKRLFAGSKPDLYRLESFNASPIHDVSVAWVGEIFTIVPKNQVFKISPEGKPARPGKAKGAVKNHG